MEKRMKIIIDSKQVRVGIPKELVEKFGLNSKDKIEWSDSSGKLKGILIKNDERGYND